MIILIFQFFYLGSSEQFIYQLTPANFIKYVEGHLRNEVWFIMFSGSSCPACHEALPKFVNASEIAGGMIKFGVIDAQMSGELSEKYNVKSLPHFLIFHDETFTEYLGKRNPRDFVNTAATFLPNYIHEIDESWKSSSLEQPSAILFTNRDTIPPIWIGIGAYFHGKSIRIGICRNSDLMNSFNLIEPPKIYFMNGTNFEIYEGNNDFNSIKTSIEKFFVKRLINKIEEDDENIFYSLNLFNEKCLGGRKNCIIFIGKKPSKELEKIKELYSKPKMLWFNGINDLPFEFLKKGGIWIYNPRRDAFIYSNNIKEFSETLDRVRDGGANWIKKNHY